VNESIVSVTVVPGGPPPVPLEPLLDVAVPDGLPVDVEPPDVVLPDIGLPDVVLVEVGPPVAPAGEPAPLDPDPPVPPGVTVELPHAAVRSRSAALRIELFRMAIPSSRQSPRGRSR